MVKKNHAAVSTRRTAFLIFTILILSILDLKNNSKAKGFQKLKAGERIEVGIYPNNPFKCCRTEKCLVMMKKIEC